MTESATKYNLSIYTLTTLTRQTDVDNCWRFSGQGSSGSPANTLTAKPSVIASGHPRLGPLTADELTEARDWLAGRPVASL